MTTKKGNNLLDSSHPGGIWWMGMHFIERRYSKGQIDRAGNDLIRLLRDDPARESAIAVVDNWRSCHAYPLQVIKMTLRNRAKTISRTALIAQRLKRRPSIEIKLRDNPNMKLSQMQDIGGCRAVLSTVKDAQKLVKQYKAYHAKSPKGRSRWDGSDDFDYIHKPKPDGYRGVHLIFRFESHSRGLRAFNGQRIEIQIRSRLQHIWATAVETAQVFTGQALKSKIKNASEDWLRFFALTSSAFARREKSPIVPGTSDNKDEVVRELRDIIKRANIMHMLLAWNTTIHLLEEPGARKDASAFLLTLYPSQSLLRIGSFTQFEMEKAQNAYEAAEKETENDSTVQVVLVSVEDLDVLHKAYPNYYADTHDFMREVTAEIGTT